MKEEIVYLNRLVDMIFKLIPLREEHDDGHDAHLEEYLNTLCDNYDGAMSRYKRLACIPNFVETRNNIEYMRMKFADIPFARWRNLAFRSIHHINDIIAAHNEGV